jgi:hypothetical protein
MATHYKIRSKTNRELYVKGTPAYHSYNKDGRLFSSIGQLRTFITCVLNSGSEHVRRDLHDWEVVELELRHVDTKDLIDVIKPEKIIKLLQR